MTAETTEYRLWVDWEREVASFHPELGFDVVSFCSQENYQANLRILIQSGFRFQ